MNQTCAVGASTEEQLSTQKGGKRSKTCKRSRKNSRMRGSQSMVEQASERRLLDKKREIAPHTREQINLGDDGNEAMCRQGKF